MLKYTKKRYENNDIRLFDMVDDIRKCDMSMLTYGEVSYTEMGVYVNQQIDKYIQTHGLIIVKQDSIEINIMKITPGYTFRNYNYDDLEIAESCVMMSLYLTDKTTYKSINQIPEEFHNDDLANFLYRKNKDYKQITLPNVSRKIRNKFIGEYVLNTIKLLPKDLIGDIMKYY
mgnify:CR=1 FL=1